MRHRSWRLGLLAFIWLLVVSVPTLRTLLRVQLQGSELLPPFSPNSVSGSDVGKFYGRLAARYPSDAQVQAKAVEEAYQLAVSGAGSPLNQADADTIQKRQAVTLKQALANYDALMQKFPQQAWLIAQRLRFMTRRPLDDRVAEELEDSPQTSRPNTARRNAWQSIYSPNELEQAIELAHKGQLLEPDNSFFDWIEAQCLFGLQRDNEALVVLHQAAQKSRYDAHVKDDVQAAIKAHERVRPLLEEEKLCLVAGELLPHYAQHRHTARLAIAAGIQAERRGDHQSALKIYHDIARLGAVIGQDDYFVIGSLVGVGLESAAWASKARELTHAESYKNDRPAATQLLATRFARYATTHGRSDIAAETRREAAAAIQVQQVTQHISFNEGFFGVPLHSFKTVFNLFWISKLLLAQLLLNVVLWLALSTVLRYAIAPRREAVSWLDVTSPLIVSGCVTAALIALSLLLGGGWRQLGLENSDVRGYEDLITLICRVITITPALVGVLLCGCGVVWRQRLNGWRSSIHYGVHWYQQLLGALVVLGSVVYFSLSVASLPLRHSINAKLDVGVQVGELALLQAQSGKK